MAESLGSKSVQELSLSSENLPNNYIHDHGGIGFRDALLPSESSIHIPVVDILNLTSPSTSQQELHKLHSALSSWGFFQVSFSIFIYNSNFHSRFIVFSTNNLGYKPWYDEFVS